MTNWFRPETSIYWGLISLALVFTLDMLAPLGIAVGVLYIFSFVIVNPKKDSTILIFSGLVIGLVFFKYLINYNTFLLDDFAFYNRLITIAVIIFITLISISYRRLTARANEERRKYQEELEKLVFVISHDLRKPITTCMGIVNLIEDDKEMKLEELRKMLEHLKAGAIEMDIYTRKLTEKISELEKNKINSSKLL
jgi:signal transduction histidine kinase